MIQIIRTDWTKQISPAIIQLSERSWSLLRCIVVDDETIKKADAILRRTKEGAIIADALSQPGYLSVADASKIAGVGLHAIRKWCLDKKIEGVQYHEGSVGWLIPATGLLVYLASRITTMSNSDI